MTIKQRNNNETVNYKPISLRKQQQFESKQRETPDGTSGMKINRRI